MENSKLKYLLDNIQGSDLGNVIVKRPINHMISTYDQQTLH